MFDDCKKINNLALIIKKIRVLMDIYGHKLEIEKKRPQDISNSDSLFASGLKRLKNSWNDNSYKTAIDKVNTKVEKFNEISKDKIFNYISTNQIDQMINKLAEEATDLSKDVFKKDKFKLGKIEFVINLIFDDYIEYQYLSVMYPFISSVLGEEDNFIDEIKKQLLHAYQSISLKDPSFKNVKLPAALLTGVIILTVINPLIGGTAASAAVTTGSLGSMFFGIGMAESVLALCGCTAASALALDKGFKELDIARQKKNLKKEFYSLDINQTALSLAKSIVMIMQINKYKAIDSTAEKIYAEYIENYIDIKSDITLNMLMAVDSNVNFEKSKIFNNVDKYLFNKLQTA